jgi:hypothetical protein
VESGSRKGVGESNILNETIRLNGFESTAFEFWKSELADVQ